MTFSIETSLAAGIEAIEAQIFSDGQASSISENRKGSQDALLEVLQQAELNNVDVHDWFNALFLAEGWAHKAYSKLSGGDIAIEGDKAPGKYSTNKSVARKAFANAGGTLSTFADWKELRDSIKAPDALELVRNEQKEINKLLKTLKSETLINDTVAELKAIRIVLEEATPVK